MQPILYYLKYFSVCGDIASISVYLSASLELDLNY